jgi:hypothetical protein
MILTEPASSTLDSNAKSTSPLPTNHDGKLPELAIARKKLLGVKRRLLLEHAAGIPAMAFNDSMSSESMHNSCISTNSTAFEDMNDFDRGHQQFMQQLKLDNNQR